MKKGAVLFNLILILCMCCGFCSSYATEENTLPDRVYFINLGKAHSPETKATRLDIGTAVLLESQGQYAMIDTGRNDTANDVVAYLQSLGINHLNFIIYSHCHFDHAYGLQNIVASGIKVDQIFIKNFEAETRVKLINYREKMEAKGKSIATADFFMYNDYIKPICNSNGIQIIMINKNWEGKSLKLGNMDLTLYNTKFRLAKSDKNYSSYSKLKSDAENINSVVVSMSVNGHKALFTGDQTNSTILNHVIKKTAQRVRVKGKTYYKYDLFMLSHHGLGAQGKVTKTFATHVVCPGRYVRVTSNSTKNSTGGISTYKLWTKLGSYKRQTFVYANDNAGTVSAYRYNFTDPNVVSYE